MIKYVKDKTNQATFNQWSCGDYSKNTSGTSINKATVELTQDYSTNGDTSFHVIKSNDATNYSYMGISIPLTEEDIGKTLKITLDIFTPNNNTTIQLLHNGAYNALEILQNNSFEEKYVSKVITNPAGVEFFVNTMGQLDCYVDNIRITVQ